MDILINGAISIITMIVGYYIGKRKQDAETSVVEAQASSTELDATEKAVAIWRNLAQDLKKEVDELIKQNKILKLKLQGVLQSLDRNKKDYIARDDMVKNTLLQTLQQMIGNIRK